KIAVAAIATMTVACMELTSPSDELALSLSQAFTSLPAGFTMTSNSFASDGNVGDAFLPRMHRGGPRDGGLGDIGGHGIMGGLGPDFIGGIGFGRGFGHGPFGGDALRGTCAFNSSN